MAGRLLRSSVPSGRHFCDEAVTRARCRRVHSKWPEGGGKGDAPAQLDGMRTCPYVHVRMSLRPAGALDVRPVSRLLKALGDDTRLRIVALLTHGELCVCHVQEALGLTQPNASRHLGILKNAAVVESRREGSWVYHKLAAQPDSRRAQLLQAVVRSFAVQGILKRDVERLVRVRGPASCR